MKYPVLLLLVSFAASFAQSPESKSPQDIKLPNGKRWSDVIAQADHEHNIKDSRELARLTEEIRDAIEKGDKFILSVKTLNKIEDAEKLLKTLKGRMRKN